MVRRSSAWRSSRPEGGGRGVGRRSEAISTAGRVRSPRQPGASLLHKAQLKPIPPPTAGLVLGELRMGMKRKRRFPPWGLLLVQWVGLGAFSAQGLSSVPGRGTRSRKLSGVAKQNKRKNCPSKLMFLKCIIFKPFPLNSYLLSHSLSQKTVVETRTLPLRARGLLSAGTSRLTPDPPQPPWLHSGMSP